VLSACAAAVLAAGCGAGGGAGSAPPPGSWRVEASGTEQRLDAVACLTAAHCLAVGEGGTVVATTDGGKTWRPDANPLQGSGASLYRIACAAPASCYVIARPATILVTHDGGASWSSQVLPLGLAGGDLTDQACLPTYTQISGRRVLCRLGLLDVACVSAGVCYAVAAASAAYADEPLASPAAAGSSIWMTADGGQTWTPQPAPAGVACSGDCAEGLYGYPLGWVSCLSSGACWAGGAQWLGCGHCGVVYAVLRAGGPGQRWTCAESAPTCASLAPDAAVCPSRSACYGIQSTNPFGQAISLFRSSDAGADWVSTGPDWTQGVLNAIACPDTLTCYLAGSQGTVVRTANGSALSAESSPTTHDLYGIGCAGPKSCYAVGDLGTIVALG
jgi:photosystem II stability/assembly factor-like uncharacterized protein